MSRMCGTGRLTRYPLQFGSKSQRFDGADDGFGTNSTTSSTGSPLQEPGSAHHHHATQHHTLHPRDPNPYFQYSAAALALTNPSTQSSVPGGRAGSAMVGQPRSGSVPGQTSGESMSPASMASAFSPFAGTSPNGFPYQQLHDRFPFSGAETHSATAIRG